MKLPLRLGLPLLGVLLLGLAFTEGREQFVLLLVAIAVALWSAFSLPHPGGQRRAPTLVEQSLRDAEDAADEAAEQDPSAPGGTGNGSGAGSRANGSGPDRPAR